MEAEKFFEAKPQKFNTGTSRKTKYNIKDRMKKEKMPKMFWFDK